MSSCPRPAARVAECSSRSLVRTASTTPRLTVANSGGSGRRAPLGTTDGGHVLGGRARSPILLLALVASALCGRAVAAKPPAPSPATVAALPPEAVLGRGAAVPFVEYE